MVCAINDYIRTSWENIRTDLALHGEHNVTVTSTRRSSASAPGGSELLVDADTRAALVDTVRRVVTKDRRKRKDGAIVPFPWITLLFVALGRYRAGQLAFLGRHANGVFSEYDIDSDSPNRIVRRGLVFDPELRFAGMIVSATDDRGGGLHGVVDRRWISTRTFAETIERDRTRSYVAQRLWRWLPGVDLIVDTAANNVYRFGGVHGLDRGDDSWVQLPEEVEALVPLFAKTLALPNGYYDRRLIDTQCGDYEAVASNREAVAWLRAKHRSIIEARIDRGEINVARALPGLYRGADLTVACDRLLTACNGDIDKIQIVIDVLEGQDDAPPSSYVRRMLASWRPDQGPPRLEIAIPYLVRRRLDGEELPIKLRSLPASYLPASLLAARALLYLLLHDPAHGRAIAARCLVSDESASLAFATSLLVAIRATWCAQLIRDALPAAHHADVLKAAIALIEQRPELDESSMGAPTALLVGRWRHEIAHALDDEQRAVLLDGCARLAD